MPQFVDRPIKIITDYIANELNRIGSNELGMELVKTVNYYDVQLTELINYPLLKGFRQADILTSESSRLRSNCILRYCLAHQAIDQIQPLVGLISKLILISLNDFHSKGLGSRTVYLVDSPGRPRRAEYRTLYQENSTAVYAFLNIYFEIEEGTYNYKDWIIQ